MALHQRESGLWVDGFEGKTDRIRQAVIPGNLTADQVPSRYTTYTDFLNAVRIDWVWDCVSLIAYSFASNEWALVNAEQEALEAPSDPFLQLMARPNPAMSGFAFLELAAMYLELTGNLFITLEQRDGAGRPRELYLPNPARMRIIPDPKSYVKGYVYDATGQSFGSGFGTGKQLIPYAPDEVVHIKWSNPLDDYYGMGNVEPAAELLDIIGEMNRHELGYWRSGGRVVGTLQTDQTLTVDEFDDLASSWARASRDSKNRARVAVLQKGVKYQPIAEGLRSLDLTDIEKAKRDRVLAVFGVPLPKIGIMEQAQYKQEDADRTFHGETMHPKFTRWEPGIQPLVDLFHPDRQWRFQRRNFEDDTSKLTNANGMAAGGLFTLNEGRVYFGADPIEGGDVLLVSTAFTMIPVASLGEFAEQNMAAPEVPVDGAGDVAQQGEPPAVTVSEVPRIAPGNAPAVADAALAAANDAGQEVKSLLSPEGVRQVEADEWRRVRLEQAVRLVRSGKAHGPLDRVRGLKRARPMMRNPVMAHRAEKGRDEAIKWAMAKVGTLREAFRVQQRRITSPKRLQAILRAADAEEAINTAWDATPLQEAISGLHSAARAAGREVASSLLPAGKELDDSGWSDLGMGERITKIDATTRAAVVEQVREGLRRGYSPLQIAEGYSDEDYQGIAGVFAAATDWRAEAIARTETMVAYNTAAQDRYREGGIDKVQLLDGTGDAECAERDGEVVSLDEVPEDHPNGTLTTVPVFDGTSDLNLSDLSGDG